jgi:signal transduction histidine kinase
MEQLEKQRDIELMQSLMRAEENERRKIADQLHDEVSGMLALASLNISSTLEKGRQDEQAEKKLHKAQDILLGVTGTIRDLSHRLTPLIIEKFGFRKAIEDLADAVNVSEKIRLDTVIIGFEDSNKYPISFLNDLYRIIQELLHNIFKHSGASEAGLELVEHEGRISIIVEDNGVGIAEDLNTGGMGLNTIQSKIAYFKGRIEITRKKESGTLIVIEIAA